MEKKESSRIKDLQQKRVLDDAARRRRQRKALEALEQDNFQDDPHADLKMSKKAPKFEESMESPAPTGKKKRKSKADNFKFRYKKSFAALLEEEHMLNKDPPNYNTAGVPPSRFPDRKFCAVCGFPSNYTCVQCGARYCCVRCLGTHQDTRCLKWTA
ncbi:zinc finger HIT domain-containing protein 1-like [Saccostrea cucullata]|uniref:zinc finger HIT domain-containing protein 1-like n=1 Tax=Saccostrea cuccullata TaxID=36930 RepID=UPI002ED5AF99